VFIGKRKVQSIFLVLILNENLSFNSKKPQFLQKIRKNVPIALIYPNRRQNCQIFFKLVFGSEKINWRKVFLSDSRWRLESKMATQNLRSEEAELINISIFLRWLLQRV
jgi:hypothetical protein